MARNSHLIYSANTLLMKLFFTFAVFAFSFNLFGQIDTSLVYDEVLIIDSTLEYAKGKQEERKGSKELQKKEFSDLLNQSSGIHIRSYGLGSLATSSLRGGSSGHTLVLWNNVPLQSPLLGLLDLSLLHHNAFNQASIVKGGLSSVWGSGAVAGVISLTDNIEIRSKQKLALQSSFGSFGFRQYSGTWQDNIGIWRHKTTVDRETAVNDFEYEIREDLPRRLQTNAAYQKWNATHSSLVQLSTNASLKFNYWFQHVDREIPPTTTQNVSEAFQEDRAHRFVTNLKARQEKGETEIVVAYSAEELNFTDPLASINSPSNFNRYFIRAVQSYSPIPNLSVSLNGNADLTTASANAFQDEVSENRYSGVLTVSHKKPRYTLVATTRHERVDGQWIPIMPSIALDLKIAPTINLMVSANRNYRLPTLNDRFWTPGGNINLLAESGWSQELGIKYNKKKGRQQFASAATVYNRTMSNWILWTLADGSNFFSPFNVAQVWSRGLELNAAFTHSLNNGVIKLSGNYDYTKSTNQIPLDIPKIDKGEQLLYTPVHQGNVLVSYESNSVTLDIGTTFNGATQGINEDVESSIVTNARAAYQLARAKIFLHINNLFNQSYFIIERRPIPGRHFRIGIQLKLF